jgi:hypothetical protein
MRRERALKVVLVVVGLLFSQKRDRGHVARKPRINYRGRTGMLFRRLRSICDPFTGLPPLCTYFGAIRRPACH